jgi:hypothetical protein
MDGMEWKEAGIITTPGVVHCRLGVDDSITLAFWMCSMDVRFPVECVFDVIFYIKNENAHPNCTSKTQV